MNASTTLRRTVLMSSRALHRVAHALALRVRDGVGVCPALAHHLHVRVRARGVPEHARNDAELERLKIAEPQHRAPEFSRSSRAARARIHAHVLAQARQEPCALF